MTKPLNHQPRPLKNRRHLWNQSEPAKQGRHCIAKDVVALRLFACDFDIQFRQGDRDFAVVFVGVRRHLGFQRGYVPEWDFYTFDVVADIGELGAVVGCGAMWGAGVAVLVLVALVSEAS